MPRTHSGKGWSSAVQAPSRSTPPNTSLNATACRRTLPRTLLPRSASLGLRSLADGIGQIGRAHLAVVDGER
jgi:hypothetical protein